MNKAISLACRIRKWRVIPAKIQVILFLYIAKLWLVNFSFPQQILFCIVKFDNAKFYSVITPNAMSCLQIV